MLNKIYAFFNTRAARRKQLVSRLWYVHNKDLAEALRQKFVGDTEGRVSIMA